MTECRDILLKAVDDETGLPLKGVQFFIDGEMVGESDKYGECKVNSVECGVHALVMWKTKHMQISLEQRVLTEPQWGMQ